MEKTITPIRFIITGPESTGKSELAKEMASRHNAEFVPEYAREYLQHIKQEYTYDDVLKIARRQVEWMNKPERKKNPLIFIDTYLIITKIWMIRKYNSYPLWIDDEIRKTHNDLYFLCKPDIAWVPDVYRENGGIARNILFEDYRKELICANLKFVYIEGTGMTRTRLALQYVSRFLEFRKKNILQ